MSKPKKQRQNITAIIYDKRGRVLSIGKNNYNKTHPRMYQLSRSVKGYDEYCKIYLHAEMDAIVKCSQLDKAHLIEVYRISPDGNYRLAKPCPICRSAIIQTPIKYVKYSGNYDQYITVKTYELN